MNIKNYQLCYGSSSESEIDDDFEFGENAMELKHRAEMHPRIKESENLMLMCLLMRGNHVAKKNNIMSYCRKSRMKKKMDGSSEYSKLETVKRLFENEKYKEVIQFLKQP